MNENASESTDSEKSESASHPAAADSPADRGQSRSSALGASSKPATEGRTPVVATAASGDQRKKKKKKKKKKETGLGSSRGIETMFRSTYRVHMDLTSLADSKANIMISINGLILSIILASVAPKIDSNAWLLVPTMVVLLSCMAAIIFAVLAARPRVNSHRITLEDVEAGRANLLFFGNYSFLDEDTYVEGLTNLAQRPDDLYRSMMRDVYGIGTVLNKKFSLLRRSYMVFMYGLSLSVVAFILVFVMQALGL